MVGVNGKTMAEGLSWRGQRKDSFGTMEQAMELDKGSSAAGTSWLKNMAVHVVAIAHRLHQYNSY